MLQRIILSLGNTTIYKLEFNSALLVALMLDKAMGRRVVFGFFGVVQNNDGHNEMDPRFRYFIPQHLMMLVVLMIDKRSVLSLIVVKFTLWSNFRRFSST